MRDCLIIIVVVIVVVFVVTVKGTMITSSEVRSVVTRFVVLELSWFGRVRVVSVVLVLFPRFFVS